MKPTATPKEPGPVSAKKRLGLDLSSDYFDRLGELCKALDYSSQNEAVRAMIDHHIELLDLARQGYRPAAQHVKTNAVIGILANRLSLLARRSAT